MGIYPKKYVRNRCRIIKKYIEFILEKRYFKDDLKIGYVYKNPIGNIFLYLGIYGDNSFHFDKKRLIHAVIIQKREN